MKTRAPVAVVAAQPGYWMIWYLYDRTTERSPVIAWKIWDRTDRAEPVTLDGRPCDAWGSALIMPDGTTYDDDVDIYDCADDWIAAITASFEELYLKREAAA